MTDEPLKWEDQIVEAERVEFRDSDGVKVGECHYTDYMAFIRHDPGMIVLLWVPDKGVEAWEAYQKWWEEKS